MEKNFIHTFNVSGIYMIHNNISKKSYIGSSVNIFKRLFGKSSWSHLRALNENRHINNHLQKAYNKYGLSAFSFRLLEVCSKENLLIREQFYLDTLLLAKDLIKFKKKAYNICPIAGSSLGRTMSKKTKLKMSQATTGSKNPMYGRKGILHPRTLPVLQYDSKGKFISKYISAQDAADKTGLSINSIRNSILKGYKGGDFYWKNFKGSIPKAIKTMIAQRKKFIAQSLECRTVLSFNSLTEASVYFNMERKAFSNGIRNAVLKKNSVYKKFLWKEVN